MTSFVVKCHQANLVYVSLMAFEFDAKFIKKTSLFSLLVNNSRKISQKGVFRASEMLTVLDLSWKLRGSLFSSFVK